MKQKIINIVAPYTDKVNTLKMFSSKIKENQAKLDELKKLDPLQLTLEQYTELSQLQNFIDYLKLKESTFTKNSIGYQIETNSPFHKIGYLFSLEMEKDESLQEAAERFRSAVLNDKLDFISEAETKYNEVFQKVYNNLYQDISDSINDLISAYQYQNPNGNYLKHIEKYLPRPMDKYYIEHYQANEKDKVTYTNEPPLVAILIKPNEPKFG